MDTIVWEVEYLSPPKVIRHCKKCSAKTEHGSSGCFRVNANQRKLDIWLIYSCTECKSTWNLEIYSRINPEKLPGGLLERFAGNDAELAQRYAMDVGLLRGKGTEILLPPFCVLGPDIDFERGAAVEINSSYALGVKVSKVLQEKLALSGKRIESMAAKGAIRLENGTDIKKCRLQNRVVVLIEKGNAYGNRNKP